MKLKLLFAGTSLLFTMHSAHAGYVPLTVSSGFNADVIADGVGTGLSTTTTDVDGGGYCYYTNGWQQTASATPAINGLPATGLINSAVTSGLSFQLGNYASNNDLRITGTGSGTLTFQTPQTAQALYLAAVSGSGTSAITVQINFSDGTNQSATATVADWYGGANAAITGFKRMNRNTMALDNQTSTPVGPNIYQYAFTINTANLTKLISSVSVTRTGGSSSTAVLNVFAASVLQPVVTVPLTVASGFNADVIANGIGTGIATTDNDVDGANYCYFSNGWQQLATSTPATNGLPATGTVNSAATTGVTFQLANYTGNNDLRIAGTGNGTLTFQTPQAAQTFYLAAVSGSGSSTATVQINFTDGTNQSGTVTIADWYGGSNAAITGFKRMNRNTMALDNNTSPVGPNIYQYVFPIATANQSKFISSVSVTRTGGSSTTAILNIFAASIEPLASTCPPPTSPTATGITTTSASLNWTNSGTPLTYQIKYGAPGFPVATGGTSIFTATKPYTLNPPLAPSTSYDYYVRIVCSPGDTSAWSAVTNFTTLCNAPSVVSKKDSFTCGTGPVVLEAATTSGASIKWYPALTGGTALATGNSYTTPSISVTTTYYIAAISGTCESSPRQAVVATLRPVPVVNLGPDTTLCPGVALTLNAGNAGGAYLWSPGGQTTQTISTNAVGQYIANVTVNGCSKRDTILLTPGVAPVNNLPDTTNLCEGDATTLNAGNTGSTFAWTPGGATTQTVNVNDGGTRSVVITSPDHCKLTSSTYVKMRPLPVDNLGNDTAICESVTLVLDAGNAGYSYLWSTGATSQTINASDSGKYMVTVTTPYACVQKDSIHIAFLPEPRMEGFNFIPRFYDELSKVEFYALNPTNVTSFEWDFGDGTPLVTAMNPVHVFATSGEFNVTLRVYNECSDFALSQKINVDLPTGTATLSKDALRLNIYPNPAKSILNISNGNADYVMEDVMIFNAVGAMVYHRKADSKGMHQLSVEGFHSGIYFVRVLTDKGFVNRQVQVMR